MLHLQETKTAIVNNSKETYRNMDVFVAFFKTGIPDAYLYGSLAIMAIVFIIGLKSKGVENKIRWILCTLFVEYIAVVISSTIIFRPEVNCSFPQLELTPFWTYFAVAENHPEISIWDIILNVVLFVPFGLLAKMLYPHEPVWKILVAALALSLVIEVSQYILKRGVTQFDDVMHNIIGAVIGWLLAKLANNWMHTREIKV